MDNKFKRVFLAVGSSFLVVAFGVTIALSNKIGKNDQNAFVDEEIEQMFPEIVDYISPVGYSFKYDEADWEVIDEDNGFDIKLQHKQTKDELTIISTERLANQSLYQPDNFGRLDEKNLKNVSASFTANKSESKTYGSNKFYLLDYKVKVFDNSAESQVARYITSTENNVVKFIIPYTSQTTLTDVEKIILTYTVL